MDRSGGLGAARVAGGFAASQLGSRRSFTFDLPGQPAHEANTAIVHAFGSGSDTPPLVVAARLPAGAPVTSPGVRSQLAATLGRTAQVLPGARAGALVVLALATVPFLRSTGLGAMLIPLISTGLSATLLPVILGRPGAPRGVAGAQARPHGEPAVGPHRRRRRRPPGLRGSGCAGPPNGARVQHQPR